MDEEALEFVNTFSQKHLLHWLEALSVMGEAEIVFDILKMARRALNVRQTALEALMLRQLLIYFSVSIVFSNPFADRCR